MLQVGNLGPEDASRQHVGKVPGSLRNIRSCCRCTTGRVLLVEFGQSF